jgi:hypothetical protein
VAVGEKRRCVTCNKQVEIVHESEEGDIVHQKLSSGHTSKHITHVIRESLSLEEIVQSNVIKVRASGTLPPDITVPLSIPGIGSGQARVQIS